MEHKKSFSRTLALLLTLCLLLGLAPTAAFAAEGPAENTPAVKLTPAEPPALPMGEGDPLPTAPYCDWQSARVTAMGETVAYTLDTYNSKFTDAQVWLAVTVEKDDQALQLSFANVSKSTYAYIYSEATLKSEGPKNNNYDARFSFSSAYTGKWKAAYAGVYYVLLMPNSSSSITDISASVTFSLYDGDLNEPNDSPITATELIENVSTYYTLTGFNDADWFQITTSVPGEAIKIYLSNIDYTVPTISATLFKAADCSDGTPKDGLAVWSMEFSKNGAGAFKADEAGTYYLRLRNKDNKNGSDRALRLRFELVPGDEHELNDSWDKAFPLTFDYPVEFTLNGDNDYDWFYFETTVANEIVNLSLSGFETDYSNKLYYAIYDAAYDGLTGEMTGLGKMIYGETSVSIVHEKQMSFSSVGGHFLRIRLNGRVPVDNPLTLILKNYAAPDSQEPNDTRQEATWLAEGEPTTFNLPMGDRDWFRFSTDEPDLTLELRLTIPAGGNVYVYLYSGADYETYGNDASPLISWLGWTGSSYLGYGPGSHILRRMLREAGDYYLRIVPKDDAYAFDKNATVTYNLIPPDAHERNNSWKTAATLNEEVAAEFTLPASNDADWFRIVSTAPDQTVELNIVVPAGSGNIYVYLYSGADFVLNGDDTGSMVSWLGWTGSSYIGYGPGSHTFRRMLNDAGDYYVCVQAKDADHIFYENATISYRLISPDPHERNNSWKTATTLNEGIATSFTLPASNDSDWFRITADKPDQTLELNFVVPAGESAIYVSLYSGADFELKGDGAGSMVSWSGNSYYGYGPGSHTFRRMLNDAGDYYVRVTVREADYIFDDDATLSFRLIDPDAHERNNSYDTATELANRTVIGFTIPAANDSDWFSLGALTSGDKIKVDCGGFPKGLDSNNNYSVALRYVDEYATSYNTESYFIVRSVTATGTFTVRHNSNYYLSVNIGGSHHSDNQLWLKYTLVADDMPVTGIESIGNGGRTIFETQTLQLYANLLPYNATNQEVTWSSDTPSVATITADGLVTGVKAGSTTIKAVTKDGGYSASTTITVVEPIPVTGVSIRAELNPSSKGSSAANPYPLALDTGLQLTALVEPSGATNLDVIWSVSDETVLAVNEYGKVFAIGSGAACAIATTVDGDHQARFYFNVPDESYPVRGLSLSENARTLYMGEEGFTLTATVSPTYATNPEVIWSSSNEAVATVDQSGNVTAVAPGYVDITATAVENAAVKATCAVTVMPARTRVTGISFAETEVELGLYGTLQLVPVIAPADATDKGVIWTTNNKNVATVSRTGLVTALNLGTAIITATTRDGGFTASVTVNISATAACGDLNNDGAVDSGDALMVLRASVGLLALTEAQKSVADVNGDGDIDAGDAVLILRYDAGLIEEFPKK